MKSWLDLGNHPGSLQRLCVCSLLLVSHAMDYETARTRAAHRRAIPSAPRSWEELRKESRCLSCSSACHWLIHSGYHCLWHSLYFHFNFSGSFCHATYAPATALKCPFLGQMRYRIQEHLCFVGLLRGKEINGFLSFLPFEFIPYLHHFFFFYLLCRAVEFPHLL